MSVVTTSQKQIISRRLVIRRHRGVFIAVWSSSVLHGCLFERLFASNRVVCPMDFCEINFLSDTYLIGDSLGPIMIFMDLLLQQQAHLVQVTSCLAVPQGTTREQRHVARNFTELHDCITSFFQRHGFVCYAAGLFLYEDALKSGFRTPLTRAPLGGGQILPPLSNIRDNLRTT